MNTVDLYRPVGLKELELIKKSNYARFPPRLEEQPIFYPVLTYEYAELIIKNWNINESVANYAGAITKFAVNRDYISKFKVEIAGGPSLQELWVPSEELDEFNNNIADQIQIVGAYYGNKYNGGPILINQSLCHNPSQLYIQAEKFVKTEAEYEKWLKERS